jgi:hypothetical protein
MSSAKKNKANRENSQQSTGPTSPEGKARSSENARKSGIFSKALVIASAGERQEDFDALLSGLGETFPPQDLLSRFLVEDTAAIIWRLLRIRRYEGAEIRKQYEIARRRRLLEQASDVGLLKLRFLLDHAGLCSTAPRSAERMALFVSLAENRKQLEQTSAGLDFLLEQIKNMGNLVERDGCLSSQNAELLVQLWGMTEDVAGSISSLNETARGFKNGERADAAKFEEAKQMFSSLLKTMMDVLRERKNLIVDLERAEEQASFHTSVMLPPDVAENINRAETALRRNLFKTMGILLDVTYGISR